MKPRLSLLALLSLPALSFAGTQFDLAGPPGSEVFGSSVFMLPNGHFVVTDPFFDGGGMADIGAVYLYNPDGLLISTLKGARPGDRVGSNGALVLANGNFVVISQAWDSAAGADVGAVTWGSGIHGFSGGGTAVVSESNSLVGSSPGDAIGTVVLGLANGHYVVVSNFWDNVAVVNAGAVTWGNGNTGIQGPVSAANSLVGSHANDILGNGGIIPLSNGDSLVRSLSWDNGSAANAGAITWINGKTGIHGPVSAANSLVGASADDQVSSGHVQTLANGNYIVHSPLWDNTASGANDAGAVTWGHRSHGVSGVVSEDNSLVGTSTADKVGGSITTPLTNGHYVVRIPLWDHAVSGTANVGAVTWCDGTTGGTGAVSAENSLVGSTAEDAVGIAGVMPLANGNYVVASMNWDHGTIINAGAATWGNGTAGIQGPVSAANSLVGSTMGDTVAAHGVLPLTNGNYVVISSGWDNPVTATKNVGAATWGNGRTGIRGPVSAANSLVGSLPDDLIGYAGATALANGHYVVGSDLWDHAANSAEDAGAVTWANGSTGIRGPVSAANSLVGSSPSDRVGYVRTVALANGHYVSISPFWDNGGAVDAGAVTWGNGTTGLKGAVSPANSLVGSSFEDRVGYNNVIELKNGNYIVRSPYWTNTATAAARAGAVTWSDGRSGIRGVVSAANSLVGSLPDDSVGSATLLLPDNGNYLFRTTTCDNPTTAAADAGAVTLGNGSTGSYGLVSSANSVFGTAASAGSRIFYRYDPVRNRVIVGRADSNLVTVFTGDQIRSLAKTGHDAPDAPDIAFSTPGTAAVNAAGAVLADFTLTGAGAAGKNRALFAAPEFGGALSLVMQKGDKLADLGGGLPANAAAAALSGQVMHQPWRGLFQATVTGSGINAANNRLLLLDNGVSVSLLRRTGQPIGSGPMANTVVAAFNEVLQSHDRDLITLNYKLGPPAATTASDTGILLFDHAGHLIPNFAANEGLQAFGNDGNFGQFTGHACAGQGDFVHFGAAFKPSAGPAVAAVFRMSVDGLQTARLAQAQSSADDPPGVPEPDAVFSSFTGISQLGDEALVKATLQGVPVQTNEGLWSLPAGGLLLRKSLPVDTANLPGVVIARILRFWPAGATQVIVQVQLSGPGVTAANNQALALRQSDGALLLLLRTGTEAPGVGPAKLKTFSAVEVHPVTGHYAVLGTLTGAAPSANQALWTGNPALGNDAALQLLRLPVLRLRKGMTYTTANTPLSVVRSIAFKPAADATGAGGRGLAQAIGSNGDLAVYLVGDRKLTELVLLTP
jgi:hypothetical protein